MSSRNRLPVSICCKCDGWHDGGTIFIIVQALVFLTLGGHCGTWRRWTILYYIDAQGIWSRNVAGVFKGQICQNLVQSLKLKIAVRLTVVAVNDSYFLSSGGPGPVDRTRLFSQQPENHISSLFCIASMYTASYLCVEDPWLLGQCWLQFLVEHCLDTAVEGIGFCASG